MQGLICSLFHKKPSLSSIPMDRVQIILRHSEVKRHTINTQLFFFSLEHKRKWLFNYFLEEPIVPYKHAVIIIFFKLWPPLTKCSLDIGKNCRQSLQSNTIPNTQSFIHFFMVSYVFILLSFLFPFFLLFFFSWQNPGPFSHVLHICCPFISI